MSDLSQSLVLSLPRASKEALDQPIGDKPGNCSLSAVTLNDLLIPKPASTVIFPVRDAAERYGLAQGDLLIVDRSAKPADGQFVIISANDDLVIGRYSLCSPNMLANLSDDAENGSTGLSIWGVVTYIIRKQ